MAIMDWEEKTSGWALVPPRAALAATMGYHGISKLTPDGLEQHKGFFEGIGLKPARPYVVATGLAEILAAGTMLAGIGTRIGAISVLISQGVAIAKVHAKNGFGITKGGWEFNAALMAIAFGALIAGPGKLSAGRRLRTRNTGPLPLRLLRNRKPSKLALALALLA